MPVRIAHCRNNGIGSGSSSRGVKILAHKLCKHVFGFCANVRLANSDLAAHWLFSGTDIKKGRVRILKNGIDLKAFSVDLEKRNQVRKALGIDNSFVVGHIGHFSYQKNHEFLLDIFNEVLRRCPNAVLLLVGEGDDETKIRKKAEDLGLADHVIFYGVTDQVSSVLQAMDVFVLPSHFEGFGNVLIEAQAVGLKCFASLGVIPNSVAVTPLLNWISLDESTDKWADQIVSASYPEQRRSYCEEISRAGHNIVDMASFLQALYLS